MDDLTYNLRQLCRRNRDGSHATQADRQGVLCLASRQLRARVAISSDGVFRGDPKLGFAHLTTEMPFDEFLSILTAPPRSKERCCLHQMPLEGPFSVLLDDVVRPPYIDPDVTARPHLWMGGAGSVSPLHYDGSPNLLTQVCGRKHVVLFPPDQTKYLYPFDRSSKV